jgi:lysophospholipase L1-like esterase
MHGLRLLAINATVLLVLLVMVEGTASMLVVGRRYAERWIPRSDANDAYLTLPMYGRNPQARAYWDEFRASSVHEYADYLGWRRKDFSGRYINVANGRRATPSSTRTDGGVLAVFGGSAVWGTGVRDAETIPSWIAHHLGDVVRVENRGEAGYNAYQGFLQLHAAVMRGESIRAALFYDGVNDAHASCVNPGRNGATLEFYRMKDKIEHRRGSDPRIAQLLWAFTGYVPGPPLMLPYRCDDEATANEAAAAMVRTWKAIQDEADRAAIPVHFFLQPVAYVTQTDVNYLKIDETMRRSFQNFYKYVAPQVRTSGIRNFHDLSQPFGDRRGRFFIDFAHLTGEGNRIMAEDIVRAIGLSQN